MRLLVTNSRCMQAYVIVRALRPYAEIIVATTTGSGPFGFWPPCHAAYSRLVDRRHRVPDPELDWREGRIRPENTKREQRFIDAVLAICERERIDTIFPSMDAWVYVFSKNKAVFEERGILLPVPDYSTVLRPLDKYRTVQFAAQVGFPVPRTFLPDDEADLGRIARELEPPWVIKPRYTSGGRGLAVIKSHSELRDRTRATSQRYGWPLIQEYIPGRGGQNFYLVLDRLGRAVSACTPRVIRSAGRIERNSSAAWMSAPLHALTEKAVKLVAEMGWWGGATVQAKIDSRDGSLKLMEVNPRLGMTLWVRTALGINEPLMCVRIARGEPIEPSDSYPLGCLLVDPISDSLECLIDLLDLAAYRVRTTILSKPSVDPTAPPRSLRKIFDAYRSTYRTGVERRLSPYVQYFFADPIPTLIRTVGLYSQAPRRIVRVGR